VQRNGRDKYLFVAVVGGVRKLEAFFAFHFSIPLARFGPLVMQAALKRPANLGLDNPELQSAPRIDYYIRRTLDTLGRQQGTQQAYLQSMGEVDHLAGGGADSWSPDNFLMVLSLEQLGWRQEVGELARQFKTVDESRQDANEPFYVARAT
jgi:hypothetical protein